MKSVAPLQRGKTFVQSVHKQYGSPSMRISDVYNGSEPSRQNVSNALPMRWQSRQGENICDVSMVSLHGNTLARILAHIWLADLLPDGEPYSHTAHYNKN